MMTKYAQTCSNTFKFNLAQEIIKAKTYFCSILFLFFTLTTFGQSDYVIPVDSPAVTFSFLQRSAVEKITSNPYYKDVQYVRINDWSSIQKEGEFYFNIPGEKEVQRVIPVKIEGRYGDLFSFIGNTVDSLGQVLISTHDGIVRGNFIFHDRHYELIHVGEGLYAWAKLIPNNNTCAQPPQKVDPIQITRGKNGGREDACTYNPLRILVVFTQDAQNASTDIDGLVNQAINFFEAARNNSQIGGYVQYVRGGLTTWTEEYNADPSTDNDAADFAADNDLQSKRNLFNADLCIAITGNGYQNNTTIPFVGIAQDIGPNSNAFACLTQENAAVNSSTFSHEIAHLMGAKHHDCNHAPNGIGSNGCETYISGDYNYGYHFSRSGNHYRTIMHYPYTEFPTFGSPRVFNLINYFSNPNVQFDNRNTGDGSHDNARKMVESFGTIAGFKAGQGVPTSAIEGPFNVDINVYNTWEAVYSCGNGYTFEWRYSTDGGASYSSVISTNEQLYAYFSGGFNVTLWCRVISNNGQSANSFQTVRIRNGSRQAAVEVSTEIPVEVDFNILAPNPTSDQINLTFSIPREQIVEFQLLNANGNSLRILGKAKYQAGKHTKAFHLNDFPGMKLIRMRAEDKTITHKILVQP